MPPFTPALDPFVPREGLSRKHIHPVSLRQTNMAVAVKKNGPPWKNTSTLSAMNADEALFHRIPSFSFWCGLLEFLTFHWLQLSCNLVVNNWDPWIYPVISSKLLSQNTLQLPPNHHHLQELPPGRWNPHGWWSLTSPRNLHIQQHVTWPWHVPHDRCARHTHRNTLGVHQLFRITNDLRMKPRSWRLGTLHGNYWKKLPICKWKCFCCISVPPISHRS